MPESGTLKDNDDAEKVATPQLFTPHCQRIQFRPMPFHGLVSLSDADMTNVEEARRVKEWRDAKRGKIQSNETKRSGAE